MKKMKPAKGTATLQSCECKYVKMGTSLRVPVTWVRAAGWWAVSFGAGDSSLHHPSCKNCGLHLLRSCCSDTSLGHGGGCGRNCESEAGS